MKTNNSLLKINLSFFLKKKKQKNSEILSSVEGKAVIRQYNKISYVLVEFEVVYHTAWVREISQLQYGVYKTVQTYVR